MSDSDSKTTIAVRFRAVSRSFGEVHAVDNVDLEVRDGEFFSMLGPSGSGKTTCLRLIAGFEQPTSGSIELYGQEVSGMPPFLRPVNTVFQDYALFPHMTVGNNVAYGLMVKKVPRPEIQKRVQEMLEIVQLAGFEKRKPSQLSGGQRQRVALARALINQPRVLLLDEPLGALDLKLRQQMQYELKAIQHRVGITFIFVTHDQEEAMTMSDRIAVFNKGKIEQIGTPAEIYEGPKTTFVAGFVGTSNIFNPAQARALLDRDGSYSIRPEKIHIAPPGQPVTDSYYCINGQIKDVVYLGASTRYLVTASDGTEIVAVEQNLRQNAATASMKRSDTVNLVWQREDTIPLNR